MPEYGIHHNPPFPFIHCDMARGDAERRIFIMILGGLILVLIVVASSEKAEGIAALNDDE
ncbi:hypothetical protein D3C75_187520 [compost metagenome]|uniref:hypothetical protein n=1 Tax=Paenibacillus stellifer TaxID=169760 RepID=UPI000FB60E9D|nr:hypothetical protein [Paenibacillus stellifer]